MSIELRKNSEGEIREKLSKLSVDELSRRGKMLRSLCDQKDPNPAFVLELRLAREEWRRRFPKRAVE
jgi:hypothetical protein